MNAKERVIAQIEHRTTDRVPYTLGFEGDVAERLDAYYGSPTWRDQLKDDIVCLPLPHLGLGWDKYAGELYTDLFGSVWRVNTRPVEHVEPALKADSLDGYRFPTTDECFMPGWAGHALAFAAENRDRFVVARFGMGIFERCWTMRGFGELLTDAAANPAFFEELVETVFQHQMGIVERLVELPIDGVFFSDDWCYQQGVLIGAERWRRVLKPRVARLFELVHRAGKYTLCHSCGSLTEILPDLIEVGLDVLESVQPEAKGMNPYELKRRFGQEITFWGCLGVQQLVPFGTPAEIRAEVERLVAEMGRGGGFILTTSKGLQPETPTENAAAVVEAFLDVAGVSLA